MCGVCFLQRHEQLAPSTLAKPTKVAPEVHSRCDGNGIESTNDIAQNGHVITPEKVEVNKKKEEKCVHNNQIPVASQKLSLHILAETYTVTYQ